MSSSRSKSSKHGSRHSTTSSNIHAVSSSTKPSEIPQPTTYDEIQPPPIPPPPVVPAPPTTTNFNDASNIPPPPAMSNSPLPPLPIGAPADPPGSPSYVPVPVPAPPPPVLIPAPAIQAPPTPTHSRSRSHSRASERPSAEHSHSHQHSHSRSNSRQSFSQQQQPPPQARPHQPELFHHQNDGDEVYDVDDEEAYGDDIEDDLYDSPSPSLPCHYQEITPPTSPRRPLHRHSSSTASSASCQDNVDSSVIPGSLGSVNNRHSLPPSSFYRQQYLQSPPPPPISTNATSVSSPTSVPNKTGRSTSSPTSTIGSLSSVPTAISMASASASASAAAAAHTRSSLISITPGDQDLYFVTKPSKTLLCPLHKGLFLNPVIAKCGHTFCLHCIVSVSQQQSSHVVASTANSNNNSILPPPIGGNPPPPSVSSSGILPPSTRRSSAQAQIFLCPLDNRELKIDDLVANLALAGQIEELLVKCKYGVKSNDNGDPIPDPEGCPAEVQLADLLHHQETCEYAWEQCPYSESCAPLRRMDMVEHKKTCNHRPCPHRKAGCKFEGVKEELEQHLSECTYEKIKSFIKKTSREINDLNKIIIERDEVNHRLQEQLSNMETRYAELAGKLVAKSKRIHKLESTVSGLQQTVEMTKEALQEMKNQISALPPPPPPHEEHPLHLEPQLNCKGTFSGHTGPVWALTVSANMLISASSDYTIRVWDLNDLKSVKTKQVLKGHEGIVHAVVAIGNKLFSGSSDKLIKVWDLERMECITTCPGHDNTVCALTIAAGYLISGSHQQLKVWNLDTYECITTLVGHNHWVRAITSGGGYLYSGSYNLIKQWDLERFTCVRTLVSHGGSIYALAICNKYLLAGIYENSIEVWNMETFTCMRRLEGHVGAVYSLGVQENRFFSGSYDSSIKVWSTDTWRCTQTMVRHSSSVDALLVHGNTLFSGSADHSIKMWASKM
ncbi:Rfwd1prov protein [Pelomyxa schiedti]|nr:Rfwd1prov protein [Pelomyxa schiedti]